MSHETVDKYTLSILWVLIVSGLVNRELLGKSHIFVKISHFLWDFHQNVRFSWKSHILKISYFENITFWKSDMLEIS